MHQLIGKIAKHIKPIAAVAFVAIPMLCWSPPGRYIRHAASYNWCTFIFEDANNPYWIGNCPAVQVRRKGWTQTQVLHALGKPSYTSVPGLDV